MNEQTRQLIRELLAALDQKRHLSVAVVALRLDCSPKFLREHLDFFPNAWRFPGRQGEVRIPVQDVEAHADRFRLFHRDAIGNRKKRVSAVATIHEPVHPDVPNKQ